MPDRPEGRIYFSYGANMGLAEMGRRCPGAAFLALAELPRHRFRINRMGVATVVPDGEAAVYGVVWRLPLPDERRLDRYEDVAGGSYRKAAVRVHPLGGGEPLEAMLYLATDEVAGRPRAGYLERILDSAARHKFPGPYVAELKGWKRSP